MPVACSVIIRMIRDKVLVKEKYSSNVFATYHCNSSLYGLYLKDASGFRLLTSIGCCLNIVSLQFLLALVLGKRLA